MRGNTVGSRFPTPLLEDRPTFVGTGAKQAFDRRCGTAVLVVAADAGMRQFLATSLTPRFALVESAVDTVTADAMLARCRFDLLVSAVRLPERSAPEWVRELRSRGHTPNVLFVANDDDRQQAAQAASDAHSCLIYQPFGPEQLIVAARRCTTRREPPAAYRSDSSQISRNRARDLIIGGCPAIKELCATIERVAPRRSTLLLRGETGTGKEVAARAIHASSGRKGHFVAVNCGALPHDLLESELFGHVKGAFTGAHQAREGLIRYAHGGTLFLDEISEMPVQMQAKLLRVLEERTIRPVGTNQEAPIDVRIIAATHRDLEHEMTSGRFRHDLFYRLTVLVLQVPTLRERAADIPLLAQHFLTHLAEEMGVPAPSYRDAEFELLCNHDWPGNVRELRNVIERSLLLDCHPSRCLPVPLGKGIRQSNEDDDDLRLSTMEQRHIRAVLQGAEGNKSEAARRLGISRKTLERKLKTWASD